MEIDFSSGSSDFVGTVPPIPQQPFGLVVPGCPVQTQFVPVDDTNRKFLIRLPCPGVIPGPLASVTELVIFVVPHIPLPPDHGILCYWQISAAMSSSPGVEPPSTGFELLGGAITSDRPSSVFPTGWSEHEQVVQISSSGTPVVVTIGISVEPISNIQNIGALEQHHNRRLYVAQKVASDLFNYMQSFDTGTGGTGNMVVPKNIFDRWFQRFETRFRRDPNFFLKSKDG